MNNNISEDKHYTGTFIINDEELQGELIYNADSGVILLSISRLIDKGTEKKTDNSINVIDGKINSGASVSLYNCICVKNHIHNFTMQQLCFKVERMIWSSAHPNNRKYNKMIITLSNALAWTDLSVFENEDCEVLKFKEDIESYSVNWYGANIKFSPYINNMVINRKYEEERHIVERLQISIELQDKADEEAFLVILYKLIGLISFSINNNINVVDMYLVDYDDYSFIGKDFKDYRKFYLYTCTPILVEYKYDARRRIVKLEDLLHHDIDSVLSEIDPVINLYLSIIRYENMPVEMVFLNIVQAIETMHSRFFYKNRVKTYIKSVEERCLGDKKYEEYLMPVGQKDNDFIYLSARINDLLIGNMDTPFIKCYSGGCNYGQAVADTRHYYTHYGKEKEKKAFKGNEMKSQISLLSKVVEYYVAKLLGCDITENIEVELNRYKPIKQHI